MSISAEANGKLRTWWKKHEIAAAAVDAILNEIEKVSTAEDFTHKHAKGRHRVFDRINARLIRAGARITALRHDGQQPIAAWSYLKPQQTGVILDPAHPRDNQGCVCVRYFAMGWWPYRDRAGGVADVGSGIWSSEFTRHCLGRYLERGVGKLDDALFAAHRAFLDVDSRVVTAQSAFRLRVLDEVWVCERRVGREVGVPYTNMHYVVRTHLDFNQLGPTQEQGLVEPDPSAGEYRLGASFLALPMFKDIRKSGDRITVRIRDGMPPYIS
jgi:hypothetical protein